MIRKVTPEDVPFITALYNEYVLHTTVSFETEALTLEQMARRVEQISARFPYYIYEEDGEPLGYACIHPWKERAAYCKTLETTVYLVPGARRHGIGRQLVGRLIDDARAMGYHALIACITAENADSVAFHRRMGFKQVSLFEKVGVKFGRILDVVDYEYVLI